MRRNLFERIFFEHFLFRSAQNFLSIFSNSIRISVWESQKSARKFWSVQNCPGTWTNARMSDWHFGRPKEISRMLFGRKDVEMLNMHLNDVKRLVKILFFVESPALSHTKCNILHSVFMMEHKMLMCIHLNANVLKTKGSFDMRSRSATLDAKLAPSSVLQFVDNCAMCQLSTNYTIFIWFWRVSLQWMKCNLMGNLLTETSEWFDPALSTFALGWIQCALATPAANLLIVWRFNDVRDVTPRIHL